MTERSPSDNKYQEIKIGIKKMHRYIKDCRIKKLKKVFRNFQEMRLEDYFIKELNTCIHKKNRTYLHKICADGDIVMARLLFKFGADISICDKYDNNVLHVALNYVIENFNRDFFKDVVIMFLENADESIFTKKNRYGETPEELLKEVTGIFEKKESSYLIENESESDSDRNDDSWNEKLFFEMGDEDKFGNENYVEEEYDDLKNNMEGFSEWGDRIRKEYYRKKYPEIEKDETEKHDESGVKEKKIHGPSIADELRKKLGIMQLRESYEEACKNIFSNTTGETLLKYSDIPWPYTQEHDVSEDFYVMLDDMMEVLSYGLTDEDKKKYLKKQQIRWHPDRFSQKCGNRLHEDDREKILESVNSLSQKINSTLSSLT